MEISRVLDISGAVVLAVLFWVLFGYPHWRVWASHQRGLADLMVATDSGDWGSTHRA